MARVPIVISGSIAIDRIMRFNGAYTDYINPATLHQLSISVFLDDQNDAFGGVGANIAYSLALLGSSPILLGAVGPDAKEYMKSLANCGVITDHVYESPLPTAAFNVITDSAHNQVGGFYPGAMFDSASLSFIPWRDTGAVVVISPHDPKAMKRQVQETVDHGLRMLYDIGQQVSNTPPEDMADGVDAAAVLILNDYEMSVLSDKLGRSATSIKSSVPVVITTHGAHGSSIEGRSISKPHHIGIAETSSALDPTGAGDAYRAGFLYGYSIGWELEEAAKFGATCAAYAVESIGTQTHAFTLDDVIKRKNAAFG